jgi:hypothetical protein
VQSRDPARTDLATEAVTESQIFGALIGTDHRAVRLLAADLGAGGMISPAGSAGKAPQMGWLIRSGVRFANRARQTLSAWPISRGTEGSNPASSSGESIANPTSSPFYRAAVYALAANRWRGPQGSQCREGGSRCWRRSSRDGSSPLRRGELRLARFPVGRDPGGPTSRDR